MTIKKSNISKGVSDSSKCKSKGDFSCGDFSCKTYTPGKDDPEPTDTPNNPCGSCSHDFDLR